MPQTKKQLISELYSIILEDQVIAFLSNDDVSILFTPHVAPGVNFREGIKADREGWMYGSNTTRHFCFSKTMEEEFFRYVNHHFNKGIIQREVERLRGRRLARAA